MNDDWEEGRIILDLCGGTGAWSIIWARKGRCK